MDNKLKDLIIKSFELYDKQNDEYNILLDSISNLSLIPFNSEASGNYGDITTILLPKIFFNDKNTGEELAIHSYELLGIFDMKTKVWIWSWSFPIINRKITKDCKKILKYALDLNPLSTEESDHFFLKNQLVNSRIFLKDKNQLDILIATCSYILGRDILFIYPDIINEDPLIIQFLLIK